MRARSLSTAIWTLLAIPLIAAVPGTPDDSPRPFVAPPFLSQTGLYAPDGSIDARNRPFAPQYPLWSDGAVKSRWIHLPEGATIDVSDVDAWRFPAGTKLWKEFVFGGRKVETRLIWKAGDDEWIFATYVWNETETEARLAPENGVRNVAPVAPGRYHSIPGVGDCRSCHGSAPTPVLGFSALQLSDDRDPLAPHAEPLRPGMLTLRSLEETGRLDPPRPEFLSDPPRIRTDDPVTRAALGYLSTNCGSCHNDRGALGRLGLELLHDAAGRRGLPEPALLTALNAPGRYLVPGVDPDSSRIVAPGAPRLSALFYRMSSRRPSSQMPPLGTVVPDDEAIGLMRNWILGLGTANVP